MQMGDIERRLHEAEWAAPQIEAVARQEMERARRIEAEAVARVRACRDEIERLRAVLATSKAA